MAAVLAGVALIVTGCSEGTPAAQTNAPQQQPKPKAVLEVSPAGGAEGVAPAGPFKVSVKDGTLTSVALTGADNRVVQGELSADKTSWLATEPLGYDKAYTWSGSAVGADGGNVPVAGTFHTVKPGTTIAARFDAGDDQTYGVAMPIAVKFSAPVKDKASVEKALKVETSVPTEGAWAWLDDAAVHWRPKEYWKPGTKVNVSAKLYGVPFGDGAFGLEDVSLRFNIGRALIATADTQTHRFVVTRDGQQIFDFPASYGLESDPGRVTRSGIHVVSERHDSFKMTNRRYNYENVPVQWAVRISNNGEFVHAYPDSEYAQGKENVSHGCANLSTANAKAYFDEVIVGDPVVVTGSSVQLGAEDRDYYDWSIPWETWTGKSAL
ncbi:L,D-transpeptidase [Lentzea sp. NBRC 105346]|nr:L,D-transpeptidase [Lentzea sp. NBRC 105346]